MTIDQNFMVLGQGYIFIILKQDPAIELVQKRPTGNIEPCCAWSILDEQHCMGLSYSNTFQMIVFSENDFKEVETAGP